MNAVNYQNMMGTGPVGMAQPQGQQAGVPTSRLLQIFTQQQAQMALDWRSTIQPKERVSAVMQLYVSNPYRSRPTPADTLSRRTNMMLAKPDLSEAQATQNSMRLENEALQRQTDRVSLLKV